MFLHTQSAFLRRKSDAVGLEEYLPCPGSCCVHEVVQSTFEHVPSWVSVFCTLAIPCSRLMLLRRSSSRLYAWRPAGSGNVVFDVVSIVVVHDSQLYRGSPCWLFQQLMPPRKCGLMPRLRHLAGEIVDRASVITHRIELEVKTDADI